MLPSLPTLDAGKQRTALQNAFAPSGNGWGFTPDTGWGIDSSGIGFGGSGWEAFLSGGGTSGGSTGITGSGGSTGTGGGGPTFTWDIGSLISGAAGGAVSGAIGAATGTTGVQKAASFLGIQISWSRIAAFLLGLLLIAGGLYLIKPVQEVVNQTVRDGISG